LEGAPFAATTAKCRCRLRFHVSDTGIGIAPDRIAQLFEPYVQADATVARRFGGTGLGLSISKRLAQLLGGSIGVQSAPDSGSIFTVEIEAGIAEQSD
jgi:signal transduction histidine kinase